MKEKKHFTADEKCQAEEKNEEVSQAVADGSLDASSKSCLQSSLCPTAIDCFHTARELTILERTGGRKEVKTEEN